MSLRRECLALLLTMSFLFGCRPSATPSPIMAGEQGSAGPSVTLPDGHEVRVEIAADPETRARGLMFRPSLSDDRGMLFLFPATDVQSFWMKDTLIPLDIVWLDEQGRVVDIEANVPPCKADPCPSYTPDGPAVYVLEIAAGEASRHGLAPGAIVQIRGIEQFRVR